jgi:predicted Zn-dependent protease
VKFTPRLPPENVNISTTHPLVDLLWLTGGIFLLIGALFLFLGITTDLAVARAPVRVETWLGRLTLTQFTTTENAALTGRLRLLLQQLPKDSPLHQYDFHVFVADTDDVNAIALPGGNIVFFSGLLHQLESENELAMIMAHELGHFAHRDHLRGLGRGLGMAVAAGMLFGGDSHASQLVSKTILTFNAQYSQAQESAADHFALELLAKRYGHAGGATSFFTRLAKDSSHAFPYLLASHPHPQSRTQALNAWIAEDGLAVRAVEPLIPDILPEKDP